MRKSKIIDLRGTNASDVIKEINTLKDQFPGHEIFFGRAACEMFCGEYGAECNCSIELVAKKIRKKKKVAGKCLKTKLSK